MCLIIFAWQSHREHRLLLGANRDEFHARESAPLGAWDDEPRVIAGRDLVAGGTWLGVSRKGRFAAVTNVRDPKAGDRQAPRSRGELTGDFLRGDVSPEAYLEMVATRSQEYLGFNLLVADSESLWYLHGGPDIDSAPQMLAPGVYGLSNAALDVPWPKVRRGKAAMDSIVTNAAAGSPPDHEELLSCVQDTSLASEDELHANGLPPEMARPLSAQFIVTPTYGTRCSTSLMLSEAGDLEIQEQRFDPTGALTGTSLESFGN